MSRLEIMSPTRARIVMEGLYKDLERRIESSRRGSVQLIWPEHFWSYAMRRPAESVCRAGSVSDN